MTDIDAKVARLMLLVADTLECSIKTIRNAAEQPLLAKAITDLQAALRTELAAVQGGPVAIPDEIRKYAKAMQKDGYRGPLFWASKVIDFVADYTTPQPAQPIGGEVTGEGYMRMKYGAARGHFAWREIQEAYAQGFIDKQWFEATSAKPVPHWTPKELESAKERADQYADWFTGNTTPQPAIAQPVQPAQGDAKDALKQTLDACRHKLMLYRNAHSGEYIGGVEYTALIQMIDAAIASQPLTCVWTEQDDDAMPGTWESACGEVWSFTEGGAAENNVRFCQGCGKPVEVCGIKGESK